MNRFTKFVIMVVKAFPVHQDGDPASASVSACPFRVDLIAHVEHKYRRVNIPKKKDRFIVNEVALLTGPYAYQQENVGPQPSGSGEV